MQQAKKQKLVGCKVMDGSEPVPLYAEGTDDRNRCSCKARAEAPSDQACAWPVPGDFVPLKGELPPLSSAPAVLNWVKWQGEKQRGKLR